MKHCKKKSATVKFHMELILTTRSNLAVEQHHRCHQLNEQFTSYVPIPTSVDLSVLYNACYLVLKRDIVKVAIRHTV